MKVARRHAAEVRYEYCNLKSSHPQRIFFIVIPENIREMTINSDLDSSSSSENEGSDVEFASPKPPQVQNGGPALAIVDKRNARGSGQKRRQGNGRGVSKLNNPNKSKKSKKAPQGAVGRGQCLCFCYLAHLSRSQQTLNSVPLRLRQGRYTRGCDSGE